VILALAKTTNETCYVLHTVILLFIYMTLSGSKFMPLFEPKVAWKFESTTEQQCFCSLGN